MTTLEIFTITMKPQVHLLLKSHWKGESSWEKPLANPSAVLNNMLDLSGTILSIAR